MTCGPAPPAPPAPGDFLWWIVAAVFAYSFLKAWARREWDWFLPILGALIAIVVTPAVINFVIGGLFGHPTPLYTVEGFTLVLPSLSALEYNAALACAAYDALAEAAKALATAYGYVTAAMAAISALMTAVAVLAAFTGAGVAAVAPVISSMYKAFEAASNLHEVLLSFFTIAYSFMAIVGVLKHLAQIALWSPWLITFGVAALSVPRLRGIGALFVSLAVVSIVVSYVAGAYAADAYATAQWAQAIAKWALDLSREWQTEQNLTAGGSPAYVYMQPALWIGHYNSTFSTRALEGLYQDLVKDPVLGNNTRAAEAWRRALEAWKFAYNTTILARNVTNAPLYGGLVAAVEYGNKTWFLRVGNATDELKALVDWLDMDVYVSNASLCSMGMTAPAEKALLQRFLQRRPDKEADFRLVNETAHRLCRYLERNGLLQTWVFTWDGAFRRLCQPYAYNVTYHVGFQAGNARGVAGAWGWVVGPEGEKCYDALGRGGGCESLLAALAPGFYEYDAAAGQWAVKRDPQPGSVRAVWNFTVEKTADKPHLSKSVNLYERVEYCLWCAQWQCDANGNCWCVDWRTSTRLWREDYRIDWTYHTRRYSASVKWVDKPWRPSYLAHPTTARVDVEWEEALANVVKWWVLVSDWDPPPGGPCLWQWFGDERPYKAVTIYHTPRQPSVGYVYGWAWVSRADVSYGYNSTTLIGLVSTSPQEDVWMEGAVQSAYCTLAMARYPYRAVDDKTLLYAVANLTAINRKALAAGITYNNLTARWWQLRHIDKAFQKLEADVQRALNSTDVEERRDAEVAWNLLQFYRRMAWIDVGQLAFLPPPHETPDGYLLHQYHVVCINFHWDAKTAVNGTTKMEPASPWTLWATGYPLGYTNLTDFLIGRLAEFYARLFRKGFPPPPKNVTLVAWLGDKRFVVKGPTRFAAAGGEWWWDGSPLPYTPVDYNKTGSLPASVWGFPIYDIYGVVFQALVLMASIAGEAWARMVAGSLYALGALEALGHLFGFPTPVRLIYPLVQDIISQLGYWLGIRVAIRARLVARLLRPVKVYIDRAGRAIASKIPPAPEWLKRVFGWYVRHEPLRVVRALMLSAVEQVKMRFWREVQRRLRELERGRISGEELEEAAREAARSAAEAARQAAKEAVKRTWYALHSHDVVEAARRISARADALFRTAEEKLVEKHPAIAVLLALYRGPYGVGVVLSEGVIRWLLRTGRITAQEAEELRRLRHLFWAMASESRARAVAMEKANEEVLKRFFEHREKVLRVVSSTVEQVKKATSKEEIERALYSAAEHLARIDLRAAERVREAFELAAFGRRVGIDTTAKLAEALWERRTALEAIVEKAKELLRMHYESAPLSYEELRYAALMRQITLVKPLYAALAEARLYAAEGGVEQAKRAYEALKAVRPFERFGEVHLRELRALAKRALALERKLAEVEREIARVKELLPTADGQRASLEARLAGLEAERASIAERLMEIRARMRVEAGEAVEHIARTYRGFLEDVRREVDPAFRQLKEALVAAEVRPKLVEELTSAVKRHEEVIRREAPRWAEAVQRLEKALSTEITEEDIRLAKSLGLHKLADYLEYAREVRAAESTVAPVLGDVKVKLEKAEEVVRKLAEGKADRALAEAAEALGLRRVKAYAEEQLKWKAGEPLTTSLLDALEEARRYSDALSKAGRALAQWRSLDVGELREAAKAAREVGLEQAARAIERFVELKQRQVPETALGELGKARAVAEGLRALAEGRYLEKLSEVKAAAEALGLRDVEKTVVRLSAVSHVESLEETYRALREQLEKEGRDTSRLDAAYERLKKLSEDLAKANEDVKVAVKKYEDVIRREAVKWGEGVQQLRTLFETQMSAEDALRGAETARALGLRRVERYLSEYVKYIPAREEYSVAATAVEAAREKALSVEPFARRELEEAAAKASTAEKLLSSLRELHNVGAEEAKRLSELAKGVGLERAAHFFAEWGKVAREASERREFEALSKLARGLARGRLAEEATLAAGEGLEVGKWLKSVEGLKPLYERAVEEAAKLKASSELAKRLSEAVEKWRYLDAKELRAAAQAAREGGFPRAAEFLERAADFKAVAETAREVFERHEKALRRLRALEQSARHELSKAFAIAEGLRALLEGDFYERLSEARRAARAIGLAEVEEALAKLGRVRLSIERVGDEYTYEVGHAVRRVMADFGVDRLLLRAPLSAYVVATIDASLAREAASVFRQAFAKYEREVATTAVYLPAREAQKLGPVVSPLTAAFDFRSYVDELVKAGDLRRYYASSGRAWRELAHLIAKTSEAVLDLRAARKALEKGDDASIALAIALAYRAAKAYMRLEGDIRPLADVVAEVRYRLGLYDRAWAEFVEKVEGKNAKLKILEALRPRTVEEAVEQLRAAWAKSNYRALEERLGLTRTYAIPDAERALEYTAKALTPYRLAAMGFEEALSVARAQSLIRTAERYLKGRPLETPAREQPLYVARALSRPLPEVKPSAVDEVAREAVVRLLREVEAGGAKAKALWRQVEELVKVSPEAFAEVVAYASSARGLAAHWARQLVARVRREWETYRVLWEAPVSVRLERLRDVPAVKVEAPIPRELVALALWAEMTSKARPTAAKDVELIKRVVGEVSPVALEEARLRAERIRAVFEDIEKLKSVDLEKPVYIAFSSLEREVPGEGVKALTIDERAELSKAQRYLNHPDPRVAREGELLAKFAAGELSRSQLAEELRRLGGLYTQEGRETVEMPSRLRDLHAVLTAKLANEVAVLRDVEELKRAAVGVAFHTAVRAGLGEEDAWRELRALAALDKAAERAVRYAELLRVLRALSEGLERVVYEPELAKRWPEYRHVLLERDYALKKAEELRKEGPEKAIVAGLLEQFAEGRIKRSELLKAAEEKGVDLREFSRDVVIRAHTEVRVLVREMAAEFRQYADAPRSLRDLLEGRLPRGLYAKMAEEMGVADVVYAELGVPAKYARYGLVEGLERYVRELKRLVLQLPGDASKALVTIEALRGELAAVTPADLVADVVNKRGEVLTRLKKALEEARAEVVKTTFESIRTAGVRRIPRELLELAASAHFTAEELRMLLAELDAVRAVEGGVVEWPSFAEYTPYIFATTDEAVAKAWRKGGGLVHEAYELTEAGPRRVFILAPKNAPIDEIREAFLSLRGVEIVGEPRWISWDAVEALGFVVERSERGVVVRPRAEYQLSLEKPLPRTREAWEVVKRFRPDVVREALGHGWELVHWEDGIEAVNAYLFLRKFRGWERFEGEDVERMFEEFRRWYTPGLERHASVISRRMYGFDAVDWLKGAYAVWARGRGEFVAKYVHKDPEALARVIWWAKKWAWGRLYDLLELDFKDPTVLRAINIAVKRGFLSWGEALDLFHEWVRKNNIAKWDEEALRIALRGNVTSEDYERAVRAFIASVKTAQQVEAEREALERWKLLQERMREEAERARARRAAKPRPEAAPREEARPKEVERPREEVKQRKAAVKPAKEAKEAAKPEAVEKRGEAAGMAEKAVEQKEKPSAVERPPSAEAEAARGVEERAEEKGAVEEKAEEKVAKEEKAKEEFVRVGKVLVKRGYEEDAVAKAFAAEDPQNWHARLTPEAYFVLREALAPVHLADLEAARRWAARQSRALSILAERHGSIDVPKRVKERAVERARAVLERHAARLARQYGEEKAQAALVKVAVLLEEWVKRPTLPNAHAEIVNAMWAWEGEEKTANVTREWGFWLFREHFSELKKTADALGVDVMHLWNAYRAALERYLDVVFAYGGLVERAVTTVDKAVYATLAAAGGVALAEALQGVIRPEIVYTVSSAASLALAGRYREAVDVIKTAVHNIELAVKRVAGEVRVALERLYEAIVEAVARLLQRLGEHWRVLALVTAAVAASVLAWATAQQILADVDMAQFAKLASWGFFGLAGVRKADVDKALDEVLSGLKALEGLERGGLAGHVSRGFASAEFARLVEEAVKVKLRAEAETAETGRLIKASPASGVIRDEFDRFALNAAATVDTALGLVYEALRQKWRAVARVDVAGRENYAHVDKEFAKAFDVRKRDVVHFLRYNVGDVVYGGARAEGVVVLVFLGGEKSIRVEVLAKSVAGLPIRFEEKEWGGERWLRLAMAKIDKPKNYVAQIELKFDEKPKVEVRGSAAGVEGLRGLLVTDAYGRGIATPDPLLVKLFIGHFERAKVEVSKVSVTEAGFALKFRAVALDDKPFIELFGDIAERYGKGLWFIVDKAREMWREAVRKLHNDIMRVAEEAAEVGRKEGVEAGRRALVEGLRRLFEEREGEALSAGRLDDALAIAVAGRLTLGIVDSPREWFSLLAGDGVVDIGGKTLGFSAKYAEVAEVVLRLLVTWAGAYGAEIRTMERMAVYSSAKDAARVLGALLKGEVLERAMTLARSWSGLAGADAPKLISLLALAQLLGVVEGRWAVELWLAHKAAATPTPLEVAKALDRLFARMEGVEREKWAERGVSLYFKLRSAEGTERVAMFRLYTNFHEFYLYCDWCSDETSAKIVLGAVAEELRLLVEQLRRAAKEGQEWPRWYGNALELPAEVGWPMFLRLWKGYHMSLRIEEGGRELLSVEVLEARADGTAKFRLRYHRWRETRPDKPYVDVEIRPYHFKDGRISFVGYVYASEAEGINKEHLAEIVKLLKDKGVKGVLLVAHGRTLKFTGAFRDSVLARLGIKPELPPGEPPEVQYLGGLKFRVGDREVEFGRGYVKGGYEFYAELKFPSRDEAERFASSLSAIGVDAKVVGDTVKLDSDSFFGLLAYTGATPPGLTPLYSSDDFRVYASAEEGRMRFYFAVRHEGVWRAVDGLYREKLWGVMLARTERDVLETVRDAVAKALKAEVEEPKEERGEEGKVKAYRLYLYDHHLAPFLEHVADDVKAEPAEVRLEGRRIVIKVGGIKAEVEFKPLKHGEAVFFAAQDVVQTLAFYKSLKALGVPVEITPRGVKINSETMWALVAAAVEKGAPGKLPTEVMPGVELLNVYNIDGMKMHAFRVFEEGVHYYFAIRTKEGWRAAGGKQSGRQVQIYGETARVVADAINAMYRERDVERKVEVKQMKDGTPYVKLTNVDLELLGLTRP